MFRMGERDIFGRTTVFVYVQGCVFMHKHIADNGLKHNFGRRGTDILVVVF